MGWLPCCDGLVTLDTEIHCGNGDFILGIDNHHRIPIYARIALALKRTLEEKPSHWLVGC